MICHVTWRGGNLVQQTNSQQLTADVHFNSEPKWNILKVEFQNLSISVRKLVSEVIYESCESSMEEKCHLRESNVALMPVSQYSIL